MTRTLQNALKRQSRKEYCGKGLGHERAFLTKRQYLVIQFSGMANGSKLDNETLKLVESGGTTSILENR